MRLRKERIFWIWLVFGLAFAACGIAPGLAGEHAPTRPTPAAP